MQRSKGCSGSQITRDACRQTSLLTSVPCKSNAERLQTERRKPPRTLPLCEPKSYLEMTLRPEGLRRTDCSGVGLQTRGQRDGSLQTLVVVRTKMAQSVRSDRGGQD
jgi:hypothetical protein